MAKIKSTKPAMYSALEAAKLCGVSNQTVINWIKNEFLKAFKTPGGQFRVYAEDLVEFMESRNMNVPTELLDQCQSKNVVVPKTLLIVDDDHAFNNVMKQFIQKRYPDMQIFQAFSGFEAGSQMVIKQPKCIILDLDLPGVDGIKLCHHIQESDAFGKPIIMVVTALSDEAVKSECLSLGISKFYQKPINLPDLAESLKNIF